MTWRPEIRTLADVPGIRAQTNPQKIAMICGDRRTTWAEFEARTNRIGNGLIAFGVKPKDRIALLDQNSDTYFEILFGAFKAGAVPVTLNWRLAPPEIAYILRDSGAGILFAGERHAALTKAASSGSPVRQTIAIDGTLPGAFSLERWRAQQSDEPPELAGAGPGDTAVQMYTSGTTGHPKGVEIPHQAFYALRRAREEDKAHFDPELDWNDWNDNEVSLVAMPGFHISGSGWGIMSLYNGACTIVLAQFDAGEVLRAIREHRISKTVFVPTTIHQLLQHPDCAKTDFSSIRHLLYGASPIPLDLLREAIATFKCGFVQVYGMTETTGAVTYLPAGDHDPRGNQRMRSAGKAMTGVKIDVRDASGKSLPPGETGEIWIHSPSRMNGYWNLKEATAATLTQDGWVKTGDAGYLDEDGYVYVQDRVKDMIVSGGENIYPAEVESAIYGHPDVAEVAVIAVPDPKWGEAVKAIVVPKPGTNPDPESIIAFARTRIGAYKVPKSVDFIAALPKNGTGKILKRELREPYWKGFERRVN